PAPTTGAVVGAFLVDTHGLVTRPDTRPRHGHHGRDSPVGSRQAPRRIPNGTARMDHAGAGAPRVRNQGGGDGRRPSSGDIRTRGYPLPAPRALPGRPSRRTRRPAA